MAKWGFRDSSGYQKVLYKSSKVLIQRPTRSYLIRVFELRTKFMNIRYVRALSYSRENYLYVGRGPNNQSFRAQNKIHEYQICTCTVPTAVKITCTLAMVLITRFFELRTNFMNIVGRGPNNQSFRDF